MQPKKDALAIEEEALKIARSVAFCVATVVGKYACYPNVDEATFERIHKRITGGLTKRRRSIRDVCQELRAVTSCHVKELVEPERVVDSDGNREELDEAELRLVAIADVIRRSSRLPNSVFREILTGLLSWDPPDRLVILDTLTSIIRGG